MMKNNDPSFSGGDLPCRVLSFSPTGQAQGYRVSREHLVPSFVRSIMTGGNDFDSETHPPSGLLLVGQLVLPAGSGSRDFRVWPFPVTASQTAV
ncbi:hypothetical protein CMQ_6097 [Grosmannia clavigera kw1407]|uniref:Uncharacterized protein n=1 Tax=Grosmannia clavigera (strain kw1407 / UAMH 11150) TaxID=655863 RepID=F0XMM0_GROCL|nr:uncharacterized protein CMQ_6097 [Grosmannia clavigera kw1407]EFX01155.1 hypothetical protein CMQ_6097 [Grosmannia clavigera kw1407]